jgi:GTP-binding protein
MKITSAEFVLSSSDYRNCPAADRPEYAFIGRSNVGKSSLINALTGHPGLAKTSQIPGKTQLINHFLINAAWYLVDLPGYGWAKVGKVEKEKWERMIRSYLTHRENLVCVFVLLDSRIVPQAIDLQFMQWLAEKEIPFVMVFTKADKQSRTKTQANVAHYKAVMQEQWEALPTDFVTSSILQEGRPELLDYIGELNNQFVSVIQGKPSKDSRADFS